MDVSTFLEVASFFLVDLPEKVQGNKFCFDLYWVFPHIMLYHDNNMSSENPMWLLGTQIHRVGMEGTELLEAACSFLHTSRSMRSGADVILATFLATE